MTPGNLPVHFATAETAEALRAGDAYRVTDLPPGDLFTGLAKALDFPDYFGRNWDAVEECLRDIDAEPTILLVNDAAARWQEEPQSMSTLVDVWLSTAAERDTELHLVFIW